jgi:hypothetical protein
MKNETGGEASKNPNNVFLGYVFDVVAPFLAYLLVHWFGGKAFWALTAGGLVAGASTAVNSIRRKKMDAVGVLVLLELVASVIFLLVLRDSRLLLIRPSFYTAIASVYLAFSVLAGHPLSFDGARPMAAKGGPQRLAAYERAWTNSAEFRRTHNIVTSGFAAAFFADSVLRIVIVYNFPLERSMWLSNVPHVAAMVLIVASSALAGRKFARIVDEQEMNNETARQRAEP